MSEACSCIAEIDREPLMEQAYTRVLTPRFGPPRAFVQTTTEKKIRGRKPPVIMAAFCPFCGVKYPEAPPSVDLPGLNLDRVDSDEARP